MVSDCAPPNMNGNCTPDAPQKHLLAGVEDDDQNVSLHAAHLGMGGNLKHRYDRWLQRELAKKPVAGAAASLTASGWSPVTLNTWQMLSPNVKVPFN